MLLLFIFLLSISVQAAGSFSYCGESSHYIVTVQNFEIDPNPVVISKPATFKMSATTSKVINGGCLVVSVSLFGIPVHQETRDLCKEITCPVPVGSFVLSQAQTFPPITPPGAYNIQMTMKDQNNQQLTCIHADFRIGFLSSFSKYLRARAFAA